MEIADYLLEHYYPKYRGIIPEMVPDKEMLVLALNAHAEKVVVVCDQDKIHGAAIYLTLDDETYKHIESFDLRRINVLSRLLQQKGENFHFILLTATGREAIRAGIQIVKQRNPKTISWWNPSNTHVHRYNLN